MALRKIIRETAKEMRRNIRFIFVFSLMFVISILALLLAPGPTYISLGGTFLRIGSIPEMTALDVAIIVAAYLISLFIFADAVTNINLVIKANRTLSKIPAEIFRGIFRYGAKIFLIYTIAVLLSLAVNIATFESPYHNYIYPAFSLLVFLLIFFVPPAIVIDEMETVRAISLSMKMLAAKWRLVLVWVLLGLFSITFVEYVLFTLIPLPVAPYLMVLLNGLLVIPVLTIFQTELYLEKYPLSP